ncbi:hypothetical protein OGAPHI_000817 [Ogataea philodendri]|uniref:peptide-methionine (S)-S-oxide reductase n=1 Tax=Ogataea philodendri TaxID=1378263 RepID=A0A9P8TAH6_9ASCO|nr:uncharacterized protein OGAPHI_000817 [Ogataea philodendri]KAH3671106.1 hypothetical protein OGAPHI_000817 [Ogataea philodendri]
MSAISKTLKTTPTSEVISVAAGCFWGVEHIYNKQFNGKILDTKVGYANGDLENPDYKTVCTNTTNHAETLQISYEPTKVSYKSLVDFFFLIHDPTQLNYQGPNVGTQYRSAIFTHSQEQDKIARESLQEAQKKWYPNDKIVTVIEPIKTFWDAEEYHQLYTVKNPTAHCAAHSIRTTPK